MNVRYLKLVFGITFLVCGSIFLSAQDVILETQADVNAFDPSMTVVHGDLYISGDDITDLSSLIGIKTITGNLDIRYCQSLLSLYGLDSITIVGHVLWCCRYIL